MDSKKYIGMDVHQATISLAVRDTKSLKRIFPTRSANVHFPRSRTTTDIHQQCVSYACRFRPARHLLWT